MADYIDTDGDGIPDTPAGAAGGGGTPPETWGDYYWDENLQKYVSRSSRGAYRTLDRPPSTPSETWKQVQDTNGALWQVPTDATGKQDWSRAVLISAPTKGKDKVNTMQAPDGSIWAVDPYTGEPIRQIFGTPQPASSAGPSGGGGGISGGGYSSGGGGGGGGGDSSTHTSISEVGPVAAQLQREQLAQQLKGYGIQLAGMDVNQRMSAADRAARAAEFAAQFGLNRVQVGNDLARTLADTISTTDPAAFYGLWKYGQGNLANATASGGTALSNASLAPGAYLLEQMSNLRGTSYNAGAGQGETPVNYQDWYNQVAPAAPAPAPAPSPAPTSPWGSWLSGDWQQKLLERMGSFGPRTTPVPTNQGAEEPVQGYAEGSAQPPRNYWLSPSPGSEGPPGQNKFTSPGFGVTPWGQRMGNNYTGATSLRDRLTQFWNKRGWDFGPDSRRPFGDQVFRSLNGSYPQPSPAAPPPASPVTPPQWAAEKIGELGSQIQPEWKARLDGLIGGNQVGMVNPTVAMVGDTTHPTNPFKGKPNPEFIWNPTNAPIGVIPARQLGFGNDNRMFTTPRYAEGTTAPAIASDAPKPTVMAYGARRDMHAPTVYGKAGDLYQNTNLYSYDPYTKLYSNRVDPSAMLTPGVGYRGEHTFAGPVGPQSAPLANNTLTTLPRDWAQNGLPTVLPGSAGTQIMYGRPGGRYYAPDADTLPYLQKGPNLPYGLPSRNTYAGLTYQTFQDLDEYGNPVPGTVRRELVGADQVNSPWRSWSGLAIEPNKPYSGGLTNVLTGENFSQSGLRDSVEGAYYHSVGADTLNSGGVGQFRGIRGLDPSLSGYDPAMAAKVADAEEAKVREVMGNVPAPSTSAGAPSAGLALDSVTSGTNTYTVAGGLNTSDLDPSVTAVGADGRPLPPGTVIPPGGQVTLTRLAYGTTIPRYAAGSGSGQYGDWSGDGNEYDPVTGTGGRELPDGTVNKDYADVIRNIRTGAPYPEFSYMDVTLARKPQTLLSMWSKGIQSRYGIPAGDWTQFWQQYAPNAMARSATRLGY